MPKQRKPRSRNPCARALRMRAGNAGVQLELDARVKIVPPKKGNASYRRSQPRPPFDEP